MVNAAFNLVRQYGIQCPPVMISLLEAIGTVTPFVNEEEDRAILSLHAQMVERGCQKSLPEEFDQNRVQVAYDTVTKKLSHSL